jgi:DNA mismatch repair protein MutL
VSRSLREAWEQLKGGLPSVLDLPPRPLELELDQPVRPPAPAAPPRQPHLWEREPDASGAVAALAAAFAPAPAAGGPYPVPLEAGAAEPAGPLQPPPVRYLGAFEDTYLLAQVQGEREPELWIIDQHVAHERILYERLFLRRHQPAVQPLMPPRVVRVGPAALARLAPFLEEFGQAGLEVEAFGGDSLVVRGLPDFLAEREPQALLDDLLARLDTQGKVDLDFFRRELNAELSCKAAIKKHHRLPPELAQRLVEDLLACAVPHTCPHGRPVIKKLTRTDLERSFGRRA